MTIAIRFHYGHLDRMPRCAVCGRVICDHKDLEYAGHFPAHTSAAVPLSGGSGGTGPLPQQASAPIAARRSQTSDDRGGQYANFNCMSHDEVNR